MTSIYAQKPPYLEYYKQTSFLLSKYNACNKNAILKMQSYANLMIEGASKSIGGKANLATLEVKVDPDSVYDHSYKIYSAQFSGCSVEYVTYKLSIVLDGKQYALSCLDGGMDVHIKYLYHQYTRTEKGEKLAVKITEDLPLMAKDNSVLLLKKGSSFSFDNRTSTSK